MPVTTTRYDVREHMPARDKNSTGYIQTARSFWPRSFDTNPDDQARTKAMDFARELRDETQHRTEVVKVTEERGVMYDCEPNYAYVQ